MKRVILGVWPISILLLLSHPAWAATVDIIWDKPETFRDIQGGNVNQRAFQEQVIKELGNHFAEVAQEQLPTDYKLKLTITDVDLAGDVEYFFGRYFEGIRVVRDFYFPSIAFEYQLTDGSDRVVQAGSENIKDMGFGFSGTSHINGPPFNYEKQLIDNWFEKTFANF